MRASVRDPSEFPSKKGLKVSGSRDIWKGSKDKWQMFLIVPFQLKCRDTGLILFIPALFQSRDGNCNTEICLLPGVRDCNADASFLNNCRKNKRNLKK